MNSVGIINLVKSGQKEKALQLINAALQENPDHVSALLLYAALIPEPQKGIRALERVLALEPDNQTAQKGLAALGKKLNNSQDKPIVPQPASTLPATSLGEQILSFAEKTRWLIKKVNLPIREALQEGRITFRDLAWAGQRAYQPPLAWAAATVLRADEIRQTQLTIDEAKKIIWPFKDINRPIEELIAQRKIGLKDLAYTLVRGPNPQIRQACAVIGYALLTNQLSLPAIQESSRSAPPSSTPRETAQNSRPAKKVGSPVQAQTNSRTRHIAKEPLRVLRASYYLENEAHRNLQKKEHIRNWGYFLIVLAMLVGVFPLIFAILTVFFSLPMLQHSQSIVNLGCIGSSFAILGVVSYLVLPRLERASQEYENYNKGQQGEEILAQIISQHLDGRWTLFRNLDLPDLQGDIDAVLVGPTGIYAIEVKTFSGYNRNFGDQWHRRYSGRWFPLHHNPSKQAKKNAVRLSKFLRESNVQVWVEPRVAWGGNGKLWLKKPSVRVWQLRFTDWIEKDIKRTEKSISTKQVQQIVALLKTYIKGYQHIGASEDSHKLQI